MLSKETTSAAFGHAVLRGDDRRGYEAVVSPGNFSLVQGMSAPFFPIVSGWTGALLSLQLGEDQIESYRRAVCRAVQNSTWPMPYSDLGGAVMPYSPLGACRIPRCSGRGTHRGYCAEHATPRLVEDTRGLRYTITLNEKDPIALSVAAKIARRDVSGSSFWFEPGSDEDEEWTRGAAGQLPLRTLLKVKLIEAGPVALPAYQQTTVSVSDTRSPEALERLRAAQMLLALARAKARRL